MTSDAQTDAIIRDVTRAFYSVDMYRMGVWTNDNPASE